MSMQYPDSEVPDSRTSVPSSPYLLADLAAPVFPLNGDDISELDCRITSTSKSSFSSFLRCLPLDERHIFLCFKDPKTWPALVEAADFDRLPRLLAARIKSRKNEMPNKTRLTVCEGRDGTDSSNGDIMIFPDMIRYRGLTHFDVDTFVDEVLVHNQLWLSGRPEKLMGTHIFVCAHANHAVRCGVTGPIIIARLKQEITARCFGMDVSVRPCTHLSGRKYKGNVIVYSSGFARYASITSEDVSSFVNELFHTEELFTGHLQISKTQDAQDLHLQNALKDWSGVCSDKQAPEETVCHVHRKSTSDVSTDSSPKQIYTNSRWGKISWLLETWETEDTLVLMAVLGAATSVALAYHVCRTYSRP